MNKRKVALILSALALVAGIAFSGKGKTKTYTAHVECRECGASADATAEGKNSVKAVSAAVKKVSHKAGCTKKGASVDEAEENYEINIKTE